MIKNGVMEWWSDGVVVKKNKNRGYQKLRVWSDAIGYYKQTWEEKRELGEWTDHLMVKEDLDNYAVE